MAKKRAGSSSDPVHGNVFSADELDGKKGTAGAESSEVACALEFHKLLIQLNASYLSLDEWFVSWGRFGVDPKELCATEVEIQDAIELRNQQCSLGIKQYIMPVSSFRTYVNGVCRVVTKQGHNSVIFPRHDERHFMHGCRIASILPFSGLVHVQTPVLVGMTSQL